MARLSLTRRQALAYRLTVHRLGRRLPPGEYARAARFALQDTYPRSALVSLHARTEACAPTAWEDPGLAQTYSPRRAAHVLPVADWAVFTVGRLPRDAAARASVLAEADRVGRALAGERRRGNVLPDDLDVRSSCASGRIALRWDARLTWFHEVPAPDVDLEAARRELCRRHVRGFGPTTPEAFAWWSGVSTGDARATWAALGAELVDVDVDGDRAWILAADEDSVRTAAPVRGVRLLAAEERNLLGADRTGLFAGPTRRADAARVDSHRPHLLLVDGEPAGSWGRRGGRVRVRLDRPPPADIRAEIESEALDLPIPDAMMSVHFD